MLAFMPVSLLKLLKHDLHPAGKPMATPLKSVSVYLFS